MKMQVKLFHKFVIIMTLLAVIPLGFVAVILINANEIALQDSILELHTNIAKSLSVKIEDHINGLESRLKFILKSQELLLSMSWMEKQVILASLLDSSDDILTISVAGKDGNELTKVVNEKLVKNPRLEDRSADPSFIKAMKGESVRSPVYNKNNIPMINIVFPFGSKQVIFIETSLQKLWNDIYNIRIGKKGFAFLVNDKGLMITKDRTGSIENADVAGLEIVKAVLTGMTDGSKEYTDSKNVEMIGAYAPVHSMGWGIIVQQEKNEAYRSSIIMKRNAMWAVIISGLLAAGVAFITARSLSKPVIKLIAGARKIADGDFSGEVKVGTHDEMLTLANTFNFMTKKLKEYNEMQIDRIIAERTKTAAVIYSISDGLIMTDFSGNIMLMNSPARKMLKIEEENIEDKYLFDYINDEKLKNSLAEIVENKDSTIIKEVDLSDDSKSMMIKSTTDTVETEKGQNLGMVTVLHDITLEKEIEKMKEDFVNSITHDLRSPMTSIRGFLEILLTDSVGELNEQQREFLGIVDDSSNKLLGLINNILDVAKLESGRMEVVLGDVNYEGMVDKIIKEIQPQALAGKIKLAAEGFGDLPMVRADYNLMERVIYNLVGNALKFTPPDGRVTVSGKDTGDAIEISISDTGEGIPPDFVDKVFDKFQQVGKIGKKRKGTGLGLTICKYVVESHKGKIWAESTVGEGSKFSFRIAKDLQQNDNGDVITGES